MDQEKVVPTYVSLKDYVYQYISAKIQNGELQPGEKINEAEICEKLGISRTPTREALFQLASENILNYIPRKGFYVVEYSTKKKLDLYRIIGHLEALAADLALDAMSEEDLLKMEELLDRIDIDIKFQNYTNYITHQNAFHDIYLNKSGSETLVELLNKLKNSFIRQTYFSEDKEKLFSVLAELNQEHREILRCFREKDRRALAEAVRSHWDTKHIDMI